MKQIPEVEAMLMTDIIGKKRDGGELSREEIEFFIKGVVDGSIPDYQTSGAADGDSLARYDPPRDAGPHAGDDELGRDAGFELHHGREGRQALHRRRRRQDLAGAAADGGGPGHTHGQNVRPRPRPHRRHAGQAGELPRLFERADGRAVPAARCRLWASP